MIVVTKTVEELKFIPGIGKVPNLNTISAPNVNNSLCLNSVALPSAPKFKLFANLSAAVAIYFFSG